MSSMPPEIWAPISSVVAIIVAKLVDVYLSSRKEKVEKVVARNQGDASMVEAAGDLVQSNTAFTQGLLKRLSDLEDRQAEREEEIDKLEDRIRDLEETNKEYRYAILSLGEQVVALGGKPVYSLD